ncbi:hypothetical protein BDP55DRAFT_667270 [Colletotrichum godetiae]|uniref:Uncharacterized protein n=1 Tax=Colletotrichum godetiae TaxID=1209918 RepID=A0AAJ0AI50_9PEZI|nr:uncharacterized protein BDP55DRAFT_667270 [Colletotrichum godetiae]KAK1674321.1 hypothetical protein BDP55DRAFT_667270 [Colletotrichum godetiae]
MCRGKARDSVDRDGMTQIDLPLALHCFYSLTRRTTEWTLAETPNCRSSAIRRQRTTPLSGAAVLHQASNVADAGGVLMWDAGGKPETSSKMC